MKFSTHNLNELIKFNSPIIKLVCSFVVVEFAI